MKITSIIILIFQVTLTHAQSFNENGHFDQSTKIQLKRDIKRLQKTFSKIETKILKDFEQRKMNHLIKYYGADDSNQRKEKVIKRRLEETSKIVSTLSVQDLKSIKWARKHHPNEDFIMSLGPNNEPLYGAVNPFGNQLITQEIYIEDRSIYLGKNYFAKNEKLLTLLHEISHLVEGKRTSTSNPLVENFINAQDFIIDQVDRGNDDSLLSTYQWEKFLESYHPLIY